jgi:hypothetical protein
MEFTNSILFTEGSRMFGGLLVDGATPQQVRKLVPGEAID